VAVMQVADIQRFRETATPEMKERYQGIIQTVWSGAGEFMKEFYNIEEAGKNTSANCFRAIFDATRE
jgi:hypothetical protein